MLHKLFSQAFHKDACAGKLFSFELLDANGGEIRGCAFNQCVDKFEPIMQQGAVIMLSKASLKNKRPNSVSSFCYCTSKILNRALTMLKLTLLAHEEAQANCSQLVVTRPFM